MRLLMLLGGLIGFLIGILMGSAQHSLWPTILWRASVAAFLAGILLRWWGRVWMKSLYEAQQQNRSAAAPEAHRATQAKV